jgi:diguanylate cyclase (GGDEF)-like protein
VTLRPLVITCSALALSALIANAVGLAESGQTRVWAVNAGWTLAGLVAFVGTAAAALRVGRNRVGRAWLLWASAAGIWLLGALLADGLTATGVSSRIAVDVVWALFALLSIAGLASRSVPGSFSFQLFLLDVLPVVLAATAGVSAASGAMGSSPGFHAFVIVSSVLYALLGLVGLQLLVWMASRAVNMWIITTGFALAATAGLLSSSQVHAAVAPQGHWSSPLWTLGLLVIALAAFRRALAPAAYTRLLPVEREHGARSLPGAAAILGLIVAAALTSGRTQLFLWLACAAVASFAGRTYLVRRANSEAQRQLARLAVLDPLTELLNRRGFQQTLSREIARAKRDGSELHVLLVDMDDLKRINDALGHAVGDIALQEVAKVIGAAVRSTDCAARIGGDEFLVLLPKTTQAEVMHIAERIRLAVAGLVFSSHSQVARVTASLGSVRVSLDAPSIDELLTEAHLVLRESKRAGKNRTSSRSEEHDAEGPPTPAQVVRELQHEDALRALVQPIVRLEDQLTVGYELLVRSSVAGYEMPADFFRACAEANALTLVDHKCFKVCVTAADWLDHTVRYHVNLLPTTLIELPLEHVAGRLPSDGARRGCCIEISEQQIVGDPSHLIAPVRALKEAGFWIAIDDVGFGRSSLESLLLLEPDVVKVDRACVTRVAQDLTRLRALKRLLDVAAALGADVVAEGIESPDDLRMLRKLGVSYGQGFLFGGPAETYFSPVEPGQAERGHTQRTAPMSVPPATTSSPARTRRWPIISPWRPISRAEKTTAQSDWVAFSGATIDTRPRSKATNRLS